MEKNDNSQQAPSTGDSPAAQVVASPTNPVRVSSTETIQKRSESMGDDGTSFLAGSLPPDVIRRVNALRNLQVEHHQIESKFFEEVHALECQYLSKYQSLYEKRSNIVKGSYEPTDVEAKCLFDEVQTDEEKKSEEKKDDEKTIGIPEFWLQVFRNSEALSEMIKEHDEPILKHLQDVRLTMQNENERKGFTIEFEFTPNDFFSNTILTKSYELRMGIDEREPLAYEGPELTKSTGCEIQWKKGKNVTVKTVKKRQKHKKRGTIRVVTQEVKNESFFNFFSPPTIPEDTDADAEENDDMQTLAADFEIGHMMRDSIIPKAVLYYTGEAGDDDGDYDDEDDEDDDDDDDDDDDEDPEEDEDQGHGHSHGAGGGRHHQGGKHGGPTKPRGGKHGAGGAAAAGQTECKQQ